MFLKLMDYQDRVTEVDIGELDDIAVITITVVTGDEIADVIYKDYTTARFDSSNDRMADYPDDRYEIYRVGVSENLIDNPRFTERKTSYWRWYDDKEGS